MYKRFLRLANVAASVLASVIGAISAISGLLVLACVGARLQMIKWLHPSNKPQLAQHFP